MQLLTDGIEGIFIEFKSCSTHINVDLFFLRMKKYKTKTIFFHRKHENIAIKTNQQNSRSKTLEIIREHCKWAYSFRSIEET